MPPTELLISGSITNHREIYLIPKERGIVFLEQHQELIMDKLWLPEPLLGAIPGIGGKVFGAALKF